MGGIVVPGNRRTRAFLAVAGLEASIILGHWSVLSACLLSGDGLYLSLVIFFYILVLSSANVGVKWGMRGVPIRVSLKGKMHG